MLLIDKYLFATDKKLQNLSKFIKLYISERLEIPFQLTIISSYDNNNRTIAPAKFEKYISELNKIENLKYEILLDKNIPIDDREFYTNYTKGNIGHPFDNRKTVFNQNFIATSNNIKRDYIDYSQRLLAWDKFRSSVPEKMGLTKTRLSNSVFKNRIFDQLTF